MTKVSVIVPVYNAEKAIERCIRSILDQEYQDIECIAVDDGSKDASGEILDRLAASDSRLKVIHKENGGVSKARNTALDVVNGEYVQFLDADDWIPTDSTKLLLRAMEENEADLAIGYFYRVVGENVAIQGSIDSTKALTLQEYAQFMMMSPADFYYGVLWNKLYRADILKKYHLRMQENCKFAEDFIFNLEYYLHTRKIIPLKAPVYYYVKTEGSLVSQAMSISKIYQMKTSVFAYYNQFYKNILDEKQYQKDRLLIAAFLIDGAKDGSAIGVLPGVKKLGQERIQAKYTSEKDSMLAFAYYVNKAFEQKLNTIAIQNEMNMNDIKVLAALVNAGHDNTIDDISDYTGISSLNVSIIITKLNMKGIVAMEAREGRAHVSIADTAHPIYEQIREALNDLEDIIFTDISEEDNQKFNALILKMIQNMRKIV